ncbi:hypothetical protein MPSEU_001084700 [Mayamaea pseudoterrestris]|nr:hypothetical protein MPSEU_001084700 [Mayamaea pseudoterrestris]
MILGSSSLWSRCSLTTRRRQFFLLLSLPTFCRSLASMSYSTERTVSADGTTTISLTPIPETKQSALVVLAHGLGDSADGLEDVAQVLIKQLPYAKFILPTAPTQPVTLNGGMRMNSWYDIVGLDERSNESCVRIEESRQKVTEILNREHEENKLPYSRMVLAGFSQGGALSLYTGLQMPEKLAGVCVLSGYLPHAAQFKITSGSEDVPVFHGHGTQDPVVPYRMAEKSQQAVTAKGCKSYTLKSYAVGHSIHPDELKDATEFLRNVLPDDDSFCIQLKDPSEMSIKELKAAIRKAGLQHKAVGLMEKHEFVKLVQESRNK